MYRHNITGKNIQEFEKCFLENERYRRVDRKDSVRMRHIILSFNADDSAHLSKDALLDLTRRFIRSYDPIGMYVAVPHYDRDHIHIAASVIRYLSGGIHIENKY